MILETCAEFGTSDIEKLKLYCSNFSEVHIRLGPAAAIYSCSAHAWAWNYINDISTHVEMSLI